MSCRGETGCHAFLRASRVLRPVCGRARGLFSAGGVCSGRGAGSGAGRSAAWLHTSKGARRHGEEKRWET
eukprot:4340120-Pleurochrysis_carterae.AAC.1